MTQLKGFQKKHLKSLAHGLKPVVQIGKEGMTERVIRAVDEALVRHELIKIKFIDFKDRDRKEAFIAEIALKTGGEPIGMIGHTVTFYRQQADPEKKKIELPQKGKPLDSLPSRL